MQSNILNIENWSSYKDEVGTHYTYKINNHYTYELYIDYDNIILDNDLYNLTICKIEEDDYYDIEKWLCLDKELSYCLNIAKENYLLTESNREELKIEFINKIDDFVVNQYYINCATENGIIGYPIQYCPICGKNLNKS